MHYEDFVIQLGPDHGDGHSVQVLQSPAGEGTGRFRPPIDQERMDELWSDPGMVLPRRGCGLPPPLPRDLRPAPSAARSQDLRAVGVQLFDALFAGQVRSLYDQSLGAIRSSPDRGLRIKLKLDPGAAGLAAVYRFPWEYLYQAETDDYLCLSRRSPLVRYLDVPRSTQPIPLPSVLRILVAVSMPLGLTPLDLEHERRLIEEAWGQQSGVECAFLARATPDALRKALLEDAYHVLHFMGHGGFDPSSGDGVVYFENEDGSSHPLSGRALATKLKDFHETLGLVFLNACETARAPDGTIGNPFSGVAGALVLGGLPAVVAMQFPISDPAAIAFSAAFYRRLAAGDSVDEALTEGRQAVHSADPDSMEWGTPVLFVRVPDGTIFQRPVAAERPPGARSRWIGAAASVVTLILSIALVAGMFFRERAPIPVEIDHAFATNIDGLSGRLTHIELLPNGRMRLNFEFTNNTDRDLELDFQNGRTYVADDFGNRYGVVLPAEPVVTTPETSHQSSVPAGGSGRTFLDFPAPREGAKVLNVGLEPTTKDGVARPEFFQIDIPETLGKHFAAPDPPEAPAGARISEVEGAVLTSSVKDFEGKVARVVLLDERAMRWDLEFYNRSEQNQILGLRYDQIYLADEFGNRYPVLRSSRHLDGEAINAFEGPVQRAVRVEHWLEFPAPVDGARHFTLHLAGTGSSAPSFQSYRVRLPKYERARYSRPPAPEAPPSLETWSFDKEFANNVDGLESRLTRVHLLESGRTRWCLTLHNCSHGDLTAGFDYLATYLVDDAGRRYEVVAVETGAAPERAVRIELRPGLRSDHWLEFPRPRQGAKRFKLRLISHDPRYLDYGVVEVGPLHYPAGFAPAPADERETAQDALVLPVNRRFATGVEGLEARLTEVELVDSSRMRWHFELHNRGQRDLRIDFGSDQSRLRDRAGNEYRVLATGADAAERLQRFVRVHRWLAFASPRDGARKFAAELAFGRFELTLPSYDARYSQSTTAGGTQGGFVLHQGETPLNTTVEGLRGKLTTVERLANGRLRWHVEIYNETGRAFEIGFNHDDTFLGDDLGNRYRVLASDTNPNPDEVRKPYRASLASGRFTSHWFEFSGPILGASRFTLVLGSHDPASVRFLPVERVLSPAQD